MDFDVTENEGMLEVKKDGQEWCVPSLQKIPFRRYQALQRKIANAEDADQVAVDEIGAILDEYAPGMLDALDVGEAMSMISMFSVGLGES